MRGRACRVAGRLLDQRGAGLSDAERVRLESHLESCAHCTADADALAALTNLTADLPALSTFARNRAINAALCGPGEAPRRTRPRRRWLVPVATSAAAAAAAAILMFAFAGADKGERERVDVSLPPPLPADHLVMGAVDIAGQAALPGAAIPAQTVITATDASELVIAHARIALEPGSALLWRDQHDTVELRAGAIHVRVDPVPKRRLRVTTTAFTVEVVGTEFTVARDRVTVTTGRVRVLSPSDTLLAELGAGDEWARSEVASHRPTTDQPRRDRPASPRPPQPDHAAILSSARSALASGDTGAAEAAIARVLASSQSQSERAEAHTLRAECALVEGQTALAERRYLAVADRYRDLAAGENALFAAARLAASDGDATELLRRYLERYPDGRFIKEARRRLEALD